MFLISLNKELVNKPLRNAQYFCELLNLKKAQSAIDAIIIDDNEKVIEIAKNLEEKGFLISAIRPPTVHKARLRITFSAKHTKSQIKELSQLISKFI